MNKDHVIFDAGSFEKVLFFCKRDRKWSLVDGSRIFLEKCPCCGCDLEGDLLLVPFENYRDLIMNLQSCCLQAD